MVNVPLFAGNPQLQEQLRLQLPVFLQQVSEAWRPGPRAWSLSGEQSSEFKLPPASCHPPSPSSARLPSDAEPRVSLHPYQPPRHAGVAADPAGAADLADRGPRAGAQVRGAGGRQGSGSSSSRPLPLPLSATSPTSRSPACSLGSFGMARTPAPSAGSNTGSAPEAPASSPAPPAASPPAGASSAQQQLMQQMIQLLAGSGNAQVRGQRGWCRRHCVLPGVGARPGLALEPGLPLTFRPWARCRPSLSSVSTAVRQRGG